MKCLIINSYAGSLTLGTTHHEQEIVGSYEDKDFFLDCQRANFPNLDFRSFRHQWPERIDLSDTFVIAHPPCSAFSLANTQPHRRGVNSEAFKCTKVVLDYTMRNGAAAIAIESVMGALGGAWLIHQTYADENDYHIYRLLENGCMFGAQWRERFWVVFVKKGVVPNPNLQISLTPRWQTVGQVMAGYEDGPCPRNLEGLLERQKERFRTITGLTEPEIEQLLNPQDLEKTTPLGTLLWNMKFKQPESKAEDKWKMFQTHIGGFGSGQVIHLAENSLAPVLMGGSHWMYKGRNVSENGWKRLMGFPVEYVFPEKPRNYRRQMQMGLSKGVMPPIAAWVVENVVQHLGDFINPDHDPSLGPTYQLECAPDQIADFRISRKQWTPSLTVPGAVTELPEVRHWDERDQQKTRDKVSDSIVDTDIDGIDEPIPYDVPEPPRTRRQPKERLPREPRVPRSTDGNNTQLLQTRLKNRMTADIEKLTAPEKKRVICDIVEQWPDPEGPNLKELIDFCVGHRDIRCAYNATRIHIRDLVKSGQLEMVSHDVPSL
jgi:site-specific DNA-cytosine methylase